MQNHAIAAVCCITNSIIIYIQYTFIYKTRKRQPPSKQTHYYNIIKNSGPHDMNWNEEKHEKAAVVCSVMRVVIR